MIKWLLIISITLVSTSMLAFLSTYLSIIQEAQLYFGVDKSDIILLSNTFNICYLIIAPLLFPFVKRYYTKLVIASSILTAIGCVGRYLSFGNYSITLAMSILVAIGHVPIITAPYGLLDLFSDEQKGYAATIPLFVPTLGINFCFLYGMNLIASEFSEIYEFDKYNEINQLHLIIAIVGACSCICTIICMLRLKTKIREINEDKAENDQKSVFSLVKDNCKTSKNLMIVLVGWGTILGINWTYGGVFGIFLGKNGLTHKEQALFGLCANLSSAIFSNLGQWIHNKFKYSTISIIFYLNLMGLISSLYLMVSSAFEYFIFQNIVGLIIAIILLRAGFSSFVSLALVELCQGGAPVLISSLFFYVSNATNLLMIEIVENTDNTVSLTIMSITVLICMVFVMLNEGKKIVKTENFQLSEEVSVTSPQEQKSVSE